MFPAPANEAARLVALAEVDADACHTEAMNQLADLAKSMFGMALGVVTLIGSDAARVIAPVGLAGQMLPRASQSAPMPPSTAQRLKGEDATPSPA